jgi:hypothetical protein
MKTETFRIYGKEGRCRWKLFWASQGKEKDIHFGAHITNGKVYTSIHKSGIIHITTHTNDGKKYESKIKRQWSLINFKFFDHINSGALSKLSIKSIPSEKENYSKIGIFDLDISKYDNDIVFWFFLIESQFIDQVIDQMKKQFPEALFAYPKNFDPILLTVILDPYKNPYGREINIKAKDNSIKMILPPDITINFRKAIIK